MGYTLGLRLSTVVTPEQTHREKDKILQGLMAEACLVPKDYYASSVAVMAFVESVDNTPEGDEKAMWMAQTYNRQSSRNLKRKASDAARTPTKKPPAGECTTKKKHSSAALVMDSCDVPE